MSDMNPQAAQMADESMVRNLAAQAECIWPQERPLFERYGLAGPIRVLDAGCGTGELTGRLAGVYPEATLLGVDILDAHLALARERWRAVGPRLSFEHRSIFELGLADASFDLVVCRHVIQSIPYPERVIAELARVARPGGRLHVIAEDYGMICFPPRVLDSDDLWDRGPRQFAAATGTDLRVGRRAYTIFRRAGLEEVRVDYVIVDPLRASRDAFAATWTAWRDGYAEITGQHTEVSAAQFRAHFDDMIATLREPDGYGVWFVPVVSGVRP